MAYVRRTETMCDDVAERIDAMTTKALEPYEKGNIEIDTPEWNAARDAIQTAAYSDAPELKGKLPDNWLTDYKEVHTQFEIKSSDPEKRDTTIDSTISAKEYLKIKLPKHVKGGGGYYSRLSIKYSDCNEVLKGWLDGQTAIITKRAEVASQYKTVKDQVNRFLRSHASLNSALKEMPELEMYIPDEYMTKFRALTEPRVRNGSSYKPDNVDEIGIDRDALTAIAVAHRVTA